MAMRTRIFNKMTAQEVEDYLERGGDTLFVGVGVIEAHGGLPVDCEQILPEAYAVTMAEKADGLAMINLPFFFPGGTIVSNATVQVTVRQSIDYLMMLCRSLVAQGFRKIFFLSAHIPAALYIDAMCRDFFQETKVHVCHLSPNLFGMRAMTLEEAKKLPESFAFYGAYKIMGQMEYLPVDPVLAQAEDTGFGESSPAHQELSGALRPFGGKVSLYYDDARRHEAGGRVFRSEEERLEICTRGEQEIRDKVSQMDLEGLKRALDAYSSHVQDILREHPRLAGQY